ncbi:hypothetical protein AAHH79_42735, partial [Burkholderia pseudomallei]
RGHHLGAGALGAAAVQLLPAAGEARPVRDARGVAGGAARAGGGTRETEGCQVLWVCVSEPIAAFVDGPRPIFACLSL